MKRSISGILFLALLVLLPLTWLTTAIVAKMRKKKQVENTNIDPEVIEPELIQEPEIIKDVETKVEEKVNEVINNLEVEIIETVIVE